MTLATATPVSRLANFSNRSNNQTKETRQWLVARVNVFGEEVAHEYIPKPAPKGGK